MPSVQGNYPTLVGQRSYQFGTHCCHMGSGYSSYKASCTRPR